MFDGAHCFQCATKCQGAVQNCFRGSPPQTRFLLFFQWVTLLARKRGFDVPFLKDTSNTPGSRV